MLQAFGLLTSRRKQNSKKCKKCKKGVELKLTKKKKKIYTVQFRIGGKFGESLSGKANKIFEKQDL